MTLSQTYTVFTPSIWSPRINFWFSQNLVAAKFFDNYSDDVSGGGDTIYIPSLSQAFTVGDVAVTNGTVAATNVSDTKSALSLSTWSGSAFVLTDFQAAQAMKSYRIRENYMQKMAYDLAKSMDQAIIRVGAGITPSVGDSSTALLATTIEKAFGILASYSVPKSECVLFVSPKTYWNRIMAISKYYDASQFGRPSLPTGVQDLLYGVPVVITELITTCTYAAESGSAAAGYRNFLIHKSAIVYALANLDGGGSGPRLQIKDNGDLAVKPTGDIAYGTLLLNAARGVKILDKVAA